MTPAWIPIDPPFEFGRYKAPIDTQEVGRQFLCEDGSTVLIGDVNQQGSPCGCCSPDSDKLVVAYRDFPVAE